jgi:hypothetical protein
MFRLRSAPLDKHIAFLNWQLGKQCVINILDSATHFLICYKRMRTIMLYALYNTFVV